MAALCYFKGSQSIPYRAYWNVKSAIEVVRTFDCHVMDTHRSKFGFPLTKFASTKKQLHLIMKTVNKLNQEATLLLDVAFCAIHQKPTGAPGILTELRLNSIILNNFAHLRDSGFALLDQESN